MPLGLLCSYRFQTNPAPAAAPPPSHPPQEKIVPLYSRLLTLNNPGPDDRIQVDVGVIPLEEVHGALKSPHRAVQVRQSHVQGFEPRLADSGTGRAGRHGHQHDTDQGQGQPGLHLSIVRAGHDVVTL